MAELSVRPTTADDRDVVVSALTRFWGGTLVIAHGTSYDAATLPALIASRNGALVGLLTYQIADGALEVVTIDADPPHAGTGSALLSAAIEVAQTAGALRLWLITTNDNVDGLRFYQRRGLRLVGLAPGALDRSRVLKPSIPALGAYGIPLRDELTLELALGEPGSQPHVDPVASERDALGGQ